MDDKTTARPCDRHAWQPVPLPDGRTAILCGRCGQHAVTLTAETGAPLPALPQPWPVPYPAPVAPWQPWQPWPGAPTIVYGDSANAVVFPLT